MPDERLTDATIRDMLRDAEMLEQEAKERAELARLKAKYEDREFQELREQHEKLIEYMVALAERMMRAARVKDDDK